MGFDVLSYAIGLQAGKKAGDSSKTVVFAEQTLSFAYNEIFGAFANSNASLLFSIENGKEYIVEWDGTEYKRTAFAFTNPMDGSSCVALGNPIAAGQENNGDSFAIVTDKTNSYTHFLSLEQTAAHTVKIYRKEEANSYEDVHFVTFMSEDGSTELYKRPVADGDDCADPVKRGYIEEPEKESTAQYAYTHAGWSANPNGALDGNILKAVTADKTVYANFAAVLRYYTVTYYDSDGTTVLKTESLAYGTMPSYVPTKDGYDFVEWTPKTAVTEDTSYTAVWKAKAAFGTASWAEISAITTAGTSADTFKVGDTRDEVLTYADGTTEEIELVIAKIRDNGTMVLVLNHALAKLKQMHSSVTGTAANYFNNDLGKYLKNTVYPALPEELKSVIRPVNVVFTNENIRLIEEENANGTNTSTNAIYEGLPLFATQANRIRKQGKNGSTAVIYWLGTSGKSGSYYTFSRVDTDGRVQPYSGFGANTNTNNYGVVFAIDV